MKLVNCLIATDLYGLHWKGSKCYWIQKQLALYCINLPVNAITKYEIYEQSMKYHTVF